MFADVLNYVYVVWNEGDEALQLCGDKLAANAMPDHQLCSSERSFYVAVGWKSAGNQLSKEGCSGTDQLNYDQYATALAELFGTGADVLPAAVGIYAKWGAGKVRNYSIKKFCSGAGTIWRLVSLL